MKFVTLEELERIESREDVKEVQNNGFSGEDGTSRWFTVYYIDDTEEDVYVESSEI